LRNEKPSELQRRRKPLFDDQTEVRIVLAADERRGIWSHSAVLKHGRAWRGAGTLPSTASAHTLLIASLISALTDVGFRKAQELAAKNNVFKPRVVVIVSEADQTFVDGMKGNPGTTLKAARHFVDEYRRISGTFRVRFETTPELEPSLVKTWAQRKLSNKFVPVAFAPRIISETQRGL
jgi:hypothetical protein